MKRLLLVALLGAAPLIAQDTTGRGGRGGAQRIPGRAGGPSPFRGTMDSTRARQLYVARDFDDLRGCGAQCDTQIKAKRRTDSIYTAKAATAVFEFQKIKYKSRPDGLEIPAYVFAP